jgi:hypothetical protein
MYMNVADRRARGGATGGDEQLDLSAMQGIEDWSWPSKDVGGGRKKLPWQGQRRAVD